LIDKQITKQEKDKAKSKKKTKATGPKINTKFKLGFSI